MFFKASALVVFLTALGAAVLSLRQQEWETRHATTAMHRQMEQTRRATWEHEVKVADYLKPAALEHKIAVAQLELEPVTGPLPKPPTPTRTAINRGTKNGATNRTVRNRNERR